MQGPFFEKILTKESLEQLKNDGCFIRLLARSISQCLYRAGDVIFMKDDIGSEVIIINVTIYEGVNANRLVVRCIELQNFDFYV